jgi:hypothetical protein
MTVEKREHKTGTHSYGKGKICIVDRKSSVGMGIRNLAANIGC